MKVNFNFAKRQKELARQQKKKEKLARRAERQSQKGDNAGGDPDLAEIEAMGFTGEGPPPGWTPTGDAAEEGAEDGSSEEAGQAPPGAAPARK